MAKKWTVRIDEAKCDGCGKCVIACHEGVIRILDGKAKVVNESSCDGLGACIGECPRGAITVLQEEKASVLPCGCPSAKVMDLRGEKKRESFAQRAGSLGSQLQNWPIQLQLISPQAPFLKGADLLIAADCVGFACPDLHAGLLAGKVLINFCPKLDTGLGSYIEKLTEIFKLAGIKSITIAHMEVPCCYGMVKLVRDALSASGMEIPVREVTVAIRGEQK